MGQSIVQIVGRQVQLHVETVQSAGPHFSAVDRPGLHHSAGRPGHPVAHQGHGLAPGLPDRQERGFLPGRRATGNLLAPAKRLSHLLLPGRQSRLAQADGAAPAGLCRMAAKGPEIGLYGGHGGDPAADRHGLSVLHQIPGAGHQLIPARGAGSRSQDALGSAPPVCRPPEPVRTLQVDA